METLTRSTDAKGHSYSEGARFALRSHCFMSFIKPHLNSVFCLCIFNHTYVFFSRILFSLHPFPSFLHLRNLHSRPRLTEPNSHFSFLSSGLSPLALRQRLNASA